MGGRRVLFRSLHRAVYGVVIPALSRSGPFEPTAHRLYRLATQRPPRIDGLPCPLTVDGLSIWYGQDRPSFTVRGLAMGTYERATAALVRTTLRERMTVLDLGAHIGYYSVLSASLVGPGGAVWSFEPDPENRAMLERNIVANGLGDRIHVVPQAVGAAPGYARLYQSRTDAGSSSLMARESTGAGAVRVSVTTLDGWAESQGWPSVDVVKMDIEGAEPAALEGMTELSRRNPGLVMVVEFNAEALEAGGVPPEEFFSALRDRGFTRTAVIGERGLRPVRGDAEIRALSRTSRWVPVNLFCQRT